MDLSQDNPKTASRTGPKTRWIATRKGHQAWQRYPRGVDHAGEARAGVSAEPFAAWLDHERSSQFLHVDQSGWDWFAVHLDSGEKLMLFQLRQKAGAWGEAFLHGVLIRPDGTTRQLDPAQMRLGALDDFAVENRRLPLRWHVYLPEIQRELEIRARHPQQ